MTNHYVSVKEAARLTGRAETAIRQRINRGSICAIRNEWGRVLIPISELERLRHVRPGQPGHLKNRIVGQS